MIRVSSGSSPEVKAIRRLTNDLTSALTYNTLDISGMLLGGELISDDARMEMLKPLDEKTKAAILVEAVKNTMKMYPKRFNNLLQILSRSEQNLKVVEKLRSTYQGSYCHHNTIIVTIFSLPCHIEFVSDPALGIFIPVSDAQPLSSEH